MPADKIFECAVVLDTELSPGEFHATLELFHITKDILQTHYVQVKTQFCSMLVQWIFLNKLYAVFCIVFFFRQDLVQGSSDWVQVSTESLLKIKD